MSNFEEVTFSPLSPTNNDFEEVIGNDDQINGNSLEDKNNNRSRRKNHPDEMTVNFTPGNSTYWGASFNFINSIVGAGIIGIPLAIQQCGFVLGMILLLLIAFLVRQSVVMLIQCGMKNQKYNLEELSEHLLGTYGYYYSLFSMFLFAFGGQTAYMIIVGDTLPLVLQLIFPSSMSILYNRQFIVAMFGIFVILPLCLLKDMSKLAWTSFLSIAADIILIFVIFIAAFSASKEQDKHFQANDLSEINTSMFAGVGTMSFAFVCQHNSFLVFQTLKSPTVAEWKKVANISISFSYTLCLALGLIGFFAFFPYVQGDLLNNFPVGSYEVSVARAFLGISMVFTFPMECFVSRHCLLTLFHRWMKDHQNHINSGNVREANNHQDGDIELPSVVVDLESDLEDEMVVDNFNPLQQQQDKMPSSGKRPQNLPSSSKKNKKSNKKNNNSKNNKYQLVNQSFFSLEDSLHGSKDENQNSIIDFSETNDPNNRSNNTTTNINEFNRTELTVATIILWGLTLLISLFFKKLGVVSALTGVAAASSLGYTIPALIFIKSFYYDFLQLFHAIFVPEDRAMGGSSLHANPNEQHQVTQGTSSSSSIPSLAIIYLNLSALKAFLMRFGLPLFMIFFGIMTLTIGVTTIIVQESSAG